ncbi:ROK family protein [Histidinibacterium aquaticum]|uniref:ROK family protein n=1 Tax=Histidinibacterium aquaticum TaxID=2613962 RepID=A0A5J5GTI5_9RHOB|nr:ROK family protein [Histidinibacterium aquaticum]
MKATAAKQKVRPRGSESAATSLADILNIVRTGRAETRQELESASNFGRSIVADRLSVLGELGLVDESASGVATGGRAPKLVRFSAARASIVVVSVSQTAIGVGLADLSGRLLTEHHEAIETGLDASITVDRVIGLIRWFLSRHTAGPEPWGISISAPGPVTLADLEPFMGRTPDFMPGWERARLVERLVETFGVPVWMRSSHDAMTMGELRGGLGRGAESMLFVRVGRRINAGLVSEGRLYRGASGAVGLIGQIALAGQGGTLDACAGAGHVEAAGRQVAEEGRSPVLADLLRRGAEITVNEVCQAAQMGDAASVEIVSHSGRQLGAVIASLASMLDPKLIVLAGTVAQSNDIFLAAVRETVYGASPPLVTRDLQIQRSQLSGSAALLGAAWIGTEELFRPDVLREWVLTGTPLQHPAFRALRDNLAKSEQRVSEDGGEGPDKAEDGVEGPDKA